MSNCSCSCVLAVAIDARVTSERDGRPAIIYNDCKQFKHNFPARYSYYQEANVLVQFSHIPNSGN
ncbi:MAG: hypothetical protein H6747_16960 [Deltaproteobacteria bacterium]|nr:hypothetical protein [Deltaproteobacteria bacterium]